MSKPSPTSPQFQPSSSDNLSDLDHNSQCSLNRAATKRGHSMENQLSSQECQKSKIGSKLVEQFIGNSSKLLCKPMYPVRPVSGLKPRSPLQMVQSQNAGPEFERMCLLNIFSYLPPTDLSRCALVCRVWFNISSDPSLWKRIDVSGKILTRGLLMNIVRKQPEVLVLDWTAITKQQLMWLIVRLPQLRGLSLKDCSLIGALALRTFCCPPLTALDLSFVTGLNDESLFYLLSPPSDFRPGLVDKKSRLRHLRKLSLAGCNLSDLSLCYIAQSLPNLTILDVSSCPRLTDAGVAQLTMPPASTNTSLVRLNLAGCLLLTETSLKYLNCCRSLEWVDLRHIPEISPEAFNNLAASRMELVQE